MWKRYSSLKARLRPMDLAGLIVLALAILSSPAGAQQFTMPPPAGIVVMGVRVVASCGAESFSLTQEAVVEMDSTGKICTAASVSASVSGFTPSSSGARGTPFTVTTSDSSGTLPTGAVTLVTNVGANPMYCNDNGVAATTSDQYISAGGGWFAFTNPGGTTTLHCIATGGSTTANMLGGTGIPTGTVAGTGATTVTANQGGSWTVAATQSGTWTVQPGNTANTTAWLVTGTGGVFPASQSGTWTVNPTTAASWGLGATGSAVPANAPYISGDAQSSEPAKATTGNLTGVFLDLVGKPVTSPYANRENMVRGTASVTTSAVTTLLSAAGASIKNYAWVDCGRSDAGTTAITVTFNDVEAIGSGTVLVIPNSGGGGGNKNSDPIPIVTSANTSLTFATNTPISTVYCNARGFTGY